MIHPGVGEEAPLEILDILEAAGADVSHTVIAHMDRTVFRDENVLRLARRGCYIEYDLFGVECSHYQVYYRLLQGKTIKENFTINIFFLVYRR